MERYILKLSGEALGGEKKMGLDPVEVTRICEEIKEAYLKGNSQIGIVCGGGNFFRGRDSESLGLKRIDADYMGMLGTLENAIGLQNKFEAIGVKAKALTCLNVPDVLELYTKEAALKYLEEGYVVIFGGGTGKPFFSTDTATALRAQDMKAKKVLMAKNGVDGVYDSDPKTNPNAKKIDVLTHKEIISNNLNVMDLTAASIFDENDVECLVFDMNEKGNITKVLSGENIGTIIKK